MNKIVNPTKSTWSAVLKRPTKTVADIEKTVDEIFNEVKTKGDSAVLRYTQLFDGATPDNLLVSKEEISKAEKSLPSELKEAIDIAKTNITTFHAAQKTESVTVETTNGVTCWQEKRPIQKVGLYIPGGSAPLFSTILMLAVPATIAGCKEIVLCTPPDKNGEVNAAILYTAKLCGVTKIYKIGGLDSVEDRLKPSEDRVEGRFKQFLEMGGWSPKAQNSN